MNVLSSCDSPRASLTVSDGSSTASPKLEAINQGMLSCIGEAFLANSGPLEGGQTAQSRLSA